MLSLSLHPTEAIHSLLKATTELRLELQQTAMENSASLINNCRRAADNIMAVKQLAIMGNVEQLQFHSDRLAEHIDYIEDMAKVVRHVIPSEQAQIRVKHAQVNLHVYGPQIAVAANTLVKVPDSNVALENFEMFCNFFKFLESEVVQVTQEARQYVGNQQCLKPPPLIMKQPPTPTQGPPPTYPSISQAMNLLETPRPNHSLGNFNKSVPNLQAEPMNNDFLMDPNKLTPAFPEYRRHSSPNVVRGQCAMPPYGKTSLRPEDIFDSYKNVENNEMIKRAKKMALQANDMYDFTRGYGKVKTTQDLFTLAEFFAEDTNVLYKVIRLFSYNVPLGEDKRCLMAIADNLPKHCHQLHMLIQTPIVGKAATFTKVDSIIRAARQIMLLIVKVVEICHTNAQKYNLDFTNVTLETRASSTTSTMDEQPFGSSSVSGGGLGGSSSPS